MNISSLAYTKMSGGLHSILPLIVGLFLSGTVSSDPDTDIGVNNKKFPIGFKFGVSSSAYQIEGAWNEDGKGDSIWDTFLHENSSRVLDKTNGDTACDSYHKYKEDVALLKQLGVHFYRFSFSWSRILPLGTPDKINKAGVQYYTNLLKELQANGIEARVTLYHWDLPQALQQQGGWLNSTMINQWFGDYARLCFKLFGKYVNEWYTLNEPFLVCHYGHGVGLGAPGDTFSGVGEYICTKNVLLAHATAWRIYDKEFRPKQKGKINMVLDTDWFEPDTDEDKEAAERRLQFGYGLYANPIYNGNWPQVVIDRIALRSKLEGYSQSRLPVFTVEEQGFVKGTYDYLTINHYTAQMTKDTLEPPVDGVPSLEKDSKVSLFTKPTWKKTAYSYVTPWGFGKLLRWLNNTYQPKEIVITENGFSDRTGTLEDNDRIDYLRSYMSQVLGAIQDGINITGYSVWSLLDNFEWIFGYTAKYGLYHVKMDDPQRQRLPKKSVIYYSNVIKTRCILDKCDCS